VVALYKGGDQSAVLKYRGISLNSVVCKEMEHVIAGFEASLGYEWLVIRGTAWVYTGIVMWKSSNYGVPGHSEPFGRRGRYRCDYNRIFQSFRFTFSSSAA